MDNGIRQYFNVLIRRGHLGQKPEIEEAVESLSEVSGLRTESRSVGQWGPREVKVLVEGVAFVYEVPSVA